MLPLLSVCCAVERIFMQISLEEGGFLERRRRAINNSELSPQSPPLLFFLRRVQRWGRPRVSPHAHMGVFPPLCMYTVCTQEAIFQAPFLLFFFFFIRDDAPVADLSISSGRNGRRRPSNIQPPLPYPEDRPGVRGKDFTVRRRWRKKKRNQVSVFSPFFSAVCSSSISPSFPLLASPMRVRHLVGLAWCFLTSALLLSSDSETSGGSPPSEEGWPNKVECVCIYQTTAPRRSN